MNTFGRLFKASLFGESHGSCVGVLIDGCPAGLALSADDFLKDLERRKGGKAGTTARREDDIPNLASGIFKGRTTGAPLLITFANQEADSQAYEAIKDTPRPGHADFVAHHKQGGFNDYRGGGPFSGRLTLELTAAGVIAKKLMPAVKVEARLIEAGGSSDIDGAVQSAVEAQDSVGGLVECRASGLPVGLGEPFFDSAESLLSHAVFSIPGIKAIGFGAGFEAAQMRGSGYNDRILSLKGRTQTNNAGGINGGITNGNDLVFTVAVRPAASIALRQKTIDLKTGKTRALSVKGRHDVCLALRVPVILEAACAVVLADLMLAGQKIPRILR